MSKSRRELLTRSQSEKDQTQLDYQVEQDKIQLQADVLETRKALAGARQSLLEAKSADTLDSSEILKRIQTVEEYELGLEALLKLQEEMFPSEAS